MQTVHPPRQSISAEATAIAERDGAQTRVYAQQVRSLRQRVAVLEAELAAAKAAEQLANTPPLTSIDFAPAPTSAPLATSLSFPAAAPPVVSKTVVAQPDPNSVFSAPAAPAVMSVAPRQPVEQARASEQTRASQTPTTDAAPPPPPAPPVPSATDAAPLEVEPNPGFAEAWNKEPDATFAERVAEKAFFEASAIDEESRSWLLDS